jgi:ADP-heptose:LPS heptosyltransferase
LSAFAEGERLTGLPIPELAQLIRDASLFVGNDSGPAHMAAALGVPSLVLFGPSDAEVWSPWRAPAARMLKADGPIASISVDAVLSAAFEAVTA